MYCGKCGGDISDDDKFCRTCGAPSTAGAPIGRTTGGGDFIPKWVRRDPAKVLIPIGFLLVAIGSFLPWVAETGVTVLGVNMPLGGTATVLCLLAVLHLAALILSRTGVVGGWRYVMHLFNLLELALVFQFLYLFGDGGEADKLAYGYWITMAGVLVLIPAGFIRPPSHEHDLACVEK